MLAVISTHLPSALRTFLLTLAIIDDLLAITIIAFFYTDDLEVVWLLAALVPIAAFAVLVQRRVRTWWLLLPLAIVAWGLVHASGVHATVAGVLLGFTVPVLRRDGQDGPGLAEHLEHVFRPLSAAVAVPIFAFFSAGVAIDGWDGFSGRARRPDHPRRRARPGRRQDGRRLRRRRGSRQRSPMPSSTTTCPGGTCWVCRRSAASASPCPC